LADDLGLGGGLRPGPPFWVPIATGALVGLSAGLRLGTPPKGPACHVADLAIAAWLVVAANP
jgi:hypothetical protein